MKNKAIIWGCAVILLLILAAGGFFAFQLLMGDQTAKPEIFLLQPVKPQTIINTDGFLFIAAAQAKKGIDRIEFLVNGSLTAKIFPETAGATDLLTQIAWVPSAGVGIYEMTFIAYDTGSSSSAPASMTIGVISKGLSRQDADEIILAVSSSTPSQVASGGMASDGGAAAQAGAEGDSLNGDHGIGEGGEIQFIEVDGELDQIRPLESDFPPEFVGSFAFSLSREAEGVMVAMSASARDDHGVETMYIVGEVEGAVDAPVSMAHPCLGTNPCTIQANVLLRQGIHRIRAVAVDSIGQFTMHNQSHLVEVTANQLAGEPPAVAEEVLSEGLLDARFMAGLMNQVGGRFEMHPFLNAGIIFDVQNDMERGDENCRPNCPLTKINDIQLSFQNTILDNEPFLIVSCLFSSNLKTENEDGIFSVDVVEVGEKICQTTASRLPHMGGGVLQANLQTYGISTPLSPSRAICGRENLTFSRLIRRNQQVVEESEPIMITPLACPPHPPELMSMMSTTNCFDGAGNRTSDHCIHLYFRENVDQVQRVYMQTNHYVLHESIFYSRERDQGLWEKEYIINPDQTSLTIDNITSQVVYEYIMYAVSPEGVRSRISKINMRVPLPTREMISSDWRENR